MINARNVKVALTAGMMLVSSQSQAQFDVAAVVSQLKETVSGSFHDLWRDQDLAPGNGRLEKINRWKVSNGRPFNADTVSPATLQEFIEVRNNVLSLDTTGRAAEAFTIRSYVEVPQSVAATWNEGKKRFDLNTLSSTDGQVQHQAGKIGETYYNLGDLQSTELLKNPGAIAGKVVPMVDIGALYGPELTKGWKMDNVVAAEIVTEAIVDAAIDGKPVNAANLEAVRRRVNKGFVEKGQAWLDIHKDADAQLQVERIVRSLNRGETISGADQATIKNFLDEKLRPKLPAEFTTESLAAQEGGKGLLAAIVDLGQTAQKDRNKMIAVIDVIAAKFKDGSLRAFSGDQMYKLGGMSRVLGRATPDFKNIVEVIKRAKK
jgi:hypothetical protein